MLGKIEDKRRKCLDGITNSMDMNLSKLQERVKDREPWCAAIQKIKESDRIEHRIEQLKDSNKISLPWALDNALLQAAVGGPKSSFSRVPLGCPLWRVCSSGLADRQGTASSVSLLILIYYWGENLLFSQCWELKREPCSPASDSVLWLEAQNLSFSKPSLEFCALFSRKDSIYWRASGEESASWGRIYSFGSLLVPSSNSSETGNLVVVMGPLEGVQDVLGVSQSTATTRAKDQGAVISCLKNIYPCTDSIKKNISWPIHG